MKILLCLTASLFLAGETFGATATWISSRAGQPWQTMPAPELGPAQTNVPPQVRIASEKTFQTMDGSAIGYCTADGGD